jgi:hypothetical protein
LAALALAHSPDSETIRVQAGEVAGTPEKLAGQLTETN